MEWFEEWFDTPLYEQLYAHRDETDAKKLAELIQAEYPSKTYPRVVDLACGRGRHSYNFAKAGYSVLGLDLSPNAIKKAQSLVINEVSEKVIFDVHDMRKPIQEKCNLLINLFTSFGYFKNDEENAGVIKEMTKAVKNNGAIVIDFLNAEFVRTNLQPTDRMEIEGYSVLIERFLNDGMVCKDLHFTDTESGRTKVFSERVKLYDKEWFNREFEKNRFQIKQTFGDYDGNDYKPTESQRLILFAEQIT